MNNRSVLDMICASYERFFDAEKKIADYILNHKKDAVEMTVAELAKASGTSDATVSRFCRRCGFKGYQNLKLALAKEIMEEEKVFTIQTGGVLLIHNSVNTKNY